MIASWSFSMRYSKPSSWRPISFCAAAMFSGCSCSSMGSSATRSGCEIRRFRISARIFANSPSRNPATVPQAEQHHRSGHLHLDSCRRCTFPPHFRQRMGIEMFAVCSIVLCVDLPKIWSLTRSKDSLEISGGNPETPVYLQSSRMRFTRFLFQSLRPGKNSALTVHKLSAMLLYEAPAR